jgi:DNA-binding PadR family transcriptional regulator
MKPENPMRGFASSEAGEIARHLIVSVSNAVAEAAGAASQNLRSRNARSQVPNMGNLILASLEEKPISLITLRKKIAEANSGQKPDQLEFIQTLDGLIVSKLVSKTTSKDRELYALTAEGKERVISSEPMEKPGDRKMEFHESYSVMKSAGRISTLLVEVASNGTAGQKAHVTDELEAMRKRIIAILADETIG